MSRIASSNSAPVDPTWSINELLGRRPAAIAVLNAYGLDTCCGGASSLADAAREAGVELQSLIADVEAQAPAAGGAR